MVGNRGDMVVHSKHAPLRQCNAVKARTQANTMSGYNTKERRLQKHPTQDTWIPQNRNRSSRQQTTHTATSSGGKKRVAARGKERWWGPHKVGRGGSDDVR